VKWRSEADCFGQQVEKCNADDCAGTEAQNQMQLIAQPQRQQAARHGAEERRDGND
jgi:hypothetical protein